jgi:DNA-directed RNA polymerase sigma subunit (sigma70/sigma32)
MKEVGMILDIGESRVSQIHTAALIQLRSRLHGRLGSAEAHRAPAKITVEPEEA